MNFLLDTHVLIWWMEDSKRMGSRTRKALLNSSTRPFVSAVSIWEIAIKTANGRLRMADPLDIWVARLQDEWGAQALPVTLHHAASVMTLPKHHNDPFDRMLVAQAQCENLTLVTADSLVVGYDVQTMDATL